MEPFDKRAGKWWHRQLQKMLAASMKGLLPSRIVCNNSFFYNRRFETEEYFLQHCENGDILLFQDNHFFARAQRFLTRS